MTYQDRGIKKWQGFFLSEHNEQMDQQQASIRLKWREAMSSECIESVLSAAITHQSSLVIQKKPLNADAFPEPDIIGRISGVDGETIFIQSTAGIISLSFSSILNIEERKLEKWYK
ncbi:MULTISPECIES: hypothetical protein [Listeria]|uniref:hypothetical protein n=1 Tax=Listeria TaxID=1637 RepID=UPI0004D8F5AE|nr:MULTISPECIES: hypothetical protein [Listeria]KES69016.1 hypothetical protein HR83_03040 [Listeria monocytogenes]KES76179.1 hypothetical protein HS01_09835 [Listeria monocytogenes]KES82753.1 hypothetical protein HR73_02590 [Listeria monocytogenes]KES89571.1 hypothetical protein HR76_00020 [Listeria monocytogenes]KES97294.1 hypothetical protein HR94_00735 [Listeria monocytogenes]